MNSQFQLLQPVFLLLAPLSWLLLWALYRQQSQPSWQQQLPASFQAFLVRPGNQQQQSLPFVLLAIAALLAAIALAAPSWQQPRHKAQQQIPAPLVIVLQLTPDLLAADLPPSRLHQVRAKLAQLLHLQQPGQAAVVLYAGSAHLLTPFSPDPQIALNMLPALAPDIMPLAGQAADQAIAQATKLLQRSAHGAGRIVLLTRSLNPAEQRAIRQQLQGSPHSLHILGVGSLTGAPLSNPEDGLFHANSPLNQLEEAQLQRFSRKLSASYARMSTGNLDLQQSGLLVTEPSGQQRLAAAITAEHQGHWFVLPLLILLAPLARRGWLGCLLLSSLLPLQDSWAGSLPSLQHPLAEQIAANPQQALVQLHDPFWLAVAAYQAGHYQQAAQGFAALEQPIARYNLGNSLMQLGRYQEAAEAYQEVLQHWPQLAQAQHNLALSKQLLQQETSTAPQNPVQPETGLVQEQSEAERYKTARIDTTVKAPDNPDTWLQQIPDHPGELLRQRFWNEQFRPSD